jgi:hypothetical protein
MTSSVLKPWILTRLHNELALCLSEIASYKLVKDGNAKIPTELDAKTQVNGGRVQIVEVLFLILLFLFNAIIVCPR